MYILTIYKLGNMLDSARLAFPSEKPCQIVQNNLICRGYSARISEQEDMPKRDNAEVARALQFLNAGVPPLPQAVIDQLIKERTELHG